MALATRLLITLFALAALACSSTNKNPAASAMINDSSAAQKLTVSATKAGGAPTGRFARRNTVTAADLVEGARVELHSVTPVDWSEVRTGIDTLVWIFGVTPWGKGIEIPSMTITQTGTATTTDVFDFRLVPVNSTYVEETSDSDYWNFKLLPGEPLASAVRMDQNNKITFRLDNQPFRLPDMMTDRWGNDSTQTVLFGLMARIAPNASGTLHFMFQEPQDMLAYDTENGVYLKVGDRDHWQPCESNSVFTSTVIQGTPEEEIPGRGMATARLVFRIADDSPYGSIPTGAENRPVLRVVATAVDGDVRLDNLYVIAVRDLVAGAIYINGVQYGPTLDIWAYQYNRESGTGFWFDRKPVIRNGETAVIEVRVDAKDPSGALLSANEVVGVTLVAGSGNARDLNTGYPVSTESVAGAPLRVTGRLVIKADTSLTNVPIPNPNAPANSRLEGIYPEDMDVPGPESPYVVERFHIRAEGESIIVRHFPVLVPEGYVSPRAPHMYIALGPGDQGRGRGTAGYQSWTPSMSPGEVMQWDSFGIMYFHEGEEMILYWVRSTLPGIQPPDAGTVLRMDVVQGVDNAVGYSSNQPISTPAAQGVPRPAAAQ